MNAAAQAADVAGYYPRWTQCATPEPLNAYINISNSTASGNTTTNSTLSPDLTVQSCSYNKQGDDTALKVSWHGNLAVLDCELCCVRWFVTIDGRECASPGPIDGAVVQDLSLSFRGYDIARPASIVGICSLWDPECTRWSFESEHAQMPGRTAPTTSLHLATPSLGTTPCQGS